MLTTVLMACGASSAPPTNASATASASSEVAPPPASPEPDAGAPPGTAGASTEAQPSAPPPCPREESAPTAVAAFDIAALPSKGAVDGSDGAGVARVPVFGGQIYQRGKVAVGTHTALRIPITALVAEGAKDGTIEVFVSKALHFKGHPPEAMRAAGVRRNLGVATSSDGTTLVIATFGEFGTIEGGASMQLFVRVPKGLPVHARHRLSGEASEPVQWPNDEAGYKASQAGRLGYWYAAVNPVKGWKSVPLVDDPQQVASQAGKYPEEPGCTP